MTRSETARWPAFLGIDREITNAGFEKRALVVDVDTAKKHIEGDALPRAGTLR